MSMQNNTRNLTYIQAVNEGLDQILLTDPQAFVIGLGTTDPKGCFDTTKGLASKHPSKVFDMPVSENAVTGVCIGAAITGLRPILIHLRIDFTMYAMDQMINNAAKWFSMYGGQSSVPMVIRAVVGMGWGQGNQHSQNLQSLFAHVPGIKVVVPFSPFDAKGMLIAAHRDKNPVLILEHRWLQNTRGPVPEEMFEVPIGQANILRPGSDITIVSWGQPLLECLKASIELEKNNIHPEIIDLRTLTPLDLETIIMSVKKTKKLLVVDSSWKTGGFAGEIIAAICENPSIQLETNPRRITLPDFSVPSSPGHANLYYFRASDILITISQMLGKVIDPTHLINDEQSRPLDAPDSSFIGPF